MARSDIFYASLDIIPYAIRKNKRIKKFFTALDLIPLVRPDLSDLFYNYTKSLYDKVSNDISVFAISQSTKNDLLRYRPDLKPEQITVTHLAANEEVFYPVEEQAEIDKVLSKYGLEGKNYFLTINSLAPYKNSRFVIESFLEWIEDGQIKDLELVFIGKPLSRDYAADLKERISVMDKIILIEKIPDADLAALYSGAMAFLYMSLYEGFGLPILEAMQCGVPVICSNTSSLPEVAGQAAIIVNPTDRPAFIEAMKCMYKDGESRKKYSALGFEQSKNFSWQKYTDQVIHSFQDAVNGSNLLN